MQHPSPDTSFKIVEKDSIGATTSLYQKAASEGIAWDDKHVMFELGTRLAADRHIAKAASCIKSFAVLKPLLNEPM